MIPAASFSLDQLTDAYNQTRVDYLVPMPMSAHRLQEYIDVYNIDLDGSVVAMDGDQMLGLCMIGVRGQMGWITRLGVLPTSRRHGSGQAMMEYCIERLAERKAKSVYLEVILGNMPAHALFLQLGFQELGKLLVLRRPPGPPDLSPESALHRHHFDPHATVRWLDESQTLPYVAKRDRRPAWTNQTESLAAARTIRALHIVSHDSELSGWACYEPTPLQLRRVIVASDNGNDVAPVYDLLFHLHTHFPILDTIAENIPSDDPYLEAYYAHGYVTSFARIEMELQIS
jgi:GNAT superfamily N-acetyltransferase